MIIGLNIKKGSMLEWFAHVIKYNLTLCNKEVEIQSLKQNLHRYISKTTILTGFEELDMYLPEYECLVEDYLDFVLVSVHNTSPNLFYLNLNNKSNILLLDVSLDEDIAYVKKHKNSTTINIYLHEDDIDDRYDLNIQFDSLKYITVSTNLVNALLWKQ